MSDNYLSECHKIMRKYKHTPMTKFWKDYIYRDTVVSSKTPYHGVTMNKMLGDFIVYPDIFYKYVPDTIIEIGTGRGGSAIWFSDLFGIFDGRVITIDVNYPKQDVLALYQNKNIQFLYGDATTEPIYEQVSHIVSGDTWVIDDGSHMINDIINCFNRYSELVSDNGFYIIEDGMSGLLFKDHPNRQPCIAIDRILDANKDFILFTEYDKFIFTSTLRGILRKNK